jgi:MinD-like ATPase involved in chromosome partitioning or flagellar assembly
MAGTIITFYSYKGGTGRTMAIANIAWILASNGYRVLLIDWDLESPGLHRYLRPFLADPELIRTPGLIDFLVDARSSGADLPPLEKYTVGVNWTFGRGGSIDFVPSGRQDKHYSQRANSFNWGTFYEGSRGGDLLGNMRRILRANYDYALIDSPSGVGETSGVCTVQLPDLLVVLFTLNRQSIQGAAAVAASIQASRGDDLRIFPVPTRIETAEAEKRDAAMAYVRRVFAPFLSHVAPTKRATYWHDVETPYSSFYAFEEILAALRDESGSRRGVLAPNERIASWITDKTVSSLYPEDEKRRRELIDAYAFTLNDVPELNLTNRPGWSAWIRARRWVLRQRWRAAVILCAGSIVLIGLYSSRRIATLSARLEDLYSRLEVLPERVTDRLDSSRDIPAGSLPKINEVVSRAVREVLADDQLLAKSSSAPKGQEIPNESLPQAPQRH